MRYLSTILIIFVSWSLGFSQQAIMEDGQIVAENKVNSLLWEISGNGLETPSYLYGTIHMIGKDDFFLTESTKKAFKKAERVTFEINMEEMSGLMGQLSILQSAFMAENKTLRDLLSDEDYKTVSDHFQKMGMPLMFLERIKPMFLTVFAGGDMADLQGGNIVSYEMEFMQMAQADSKEMGGLETAEYQMSMFDSIPYDAQAKMLVDGIKAGDEGNDQFAEMVEMYKNQEIHAMHKMVGEDEELSEYDDLLLVTRNKNWIPVMGEQMRDKVTFFAVGAGHLGGPMGVISLLEKEGYTMTPILDND